MGLTSICRFIARWQEEKPEDFFTKQVGSARGQVVEVLKTTGNTTAVELLGDSCIKHEQDYAEYVEFAHSQKEGWAPFRDLVFDYRRLVTPELCTKGLTGIDHEDLAKYLAIMVCAVLHFLKQWVNEPCLRICCSSVMPLR